MLCLTSEQLAPIYRVLRHPLNFKFHQPPWLLPMFNWINMKLKMRFGSYLGFLSRSTKIEKTEKIVSFGLWPRPETLVAAATSLCPTGRGHRPFSALKNVLFFQTVPNPPKWFCNSQNTLLGLKSYL